MWRSCRMHGVPKDQAAAALMISVRTRAHVEHSDNSLHLRVPAPSVEDDAVRLCNQISAAAVRSATDWHEFNLHANRHCQTSASAFRQASMRPFGKPCAWCSSGVRAIRKAAIACRLLRL